MGEHSLNGGNDDLVDHEPVRAERILVCLTTTALHLARVPTSITKTKGRGLEGAGREMKPKGHRM